MASLRQVIYIFYSQFYHSVLINIQFDSIRQVISILLQVYHSAIIIQIASFRQVIYIFFPLMYHPALINIHIASFRHVIYILFFPGLSPCTQEFYRYTMYHYMMRVPITAQHTKVLIKLIIYQML